VRGRLPRAPFLYAIVDLSLVAPESAASWVGALARAGAGLIQLRAKDAAERAFLEAARAGREAARRHGVPFLVNDRVDVALMVGADGVHVGQDDLPPGVARQLLGGDAIVGLSTHTPEQARRAAREPIDYLAVGPVFGTRSKHGAGPAVGPALLTEARACSELPLVGIGGVRPENVADVIGAGADGAAVISGLSAGGLDEVAIRVGAYLVRMGGAGPRARV
jgi:thiamine-phosphate pyrophosphorylase